MYFILSREYSLSHSTDLTTRLIKSNQSCKTTQGLVDFFLHIATIEPRVEDHITSSPPIWFIWSGIMSNQNVKGFTHYTEIVIIITNASQYTNRFNTSSKKISDRKVLCRPQCVLWNGKWKGKPIIWLSGLSGSAADKQTGWLNNGHCNSTYWGP